jgi:carboxyl-terminal processing protease
VDSGSPALIESLAAASAALAHRHGGRKGDMILGFRRAGAAAAAAGFALTLAGPSAATTNEVEAAYDEIEVLAEALVQARKHYVEERSYEQLSTGALDGLLKGLDENSSFLDRQQFDRMQSDTEGHYSGVGIEHGMRNGMLTVIAAIEDGPAYKAGIHSGDLILAIDGVKTDSLSGREISARLRGEKGARVVLRIQSAGDEPPRDVEIVRDTITVTSVKGVRQIEDGIGYVRLTQFQRDTARELRDAVRELKGKGLKALLLDLRGNPGGLLTTAVEVTQLFLRRGQVIVSTRGRPGVTEPSLTRATRSGEFHDLPLVVLVNKGSASASEILAGALQDNRRAALLGETTFGKGSVQSIIRLQSDPLRALRLTTARYYTPSGRMIHGKGIAPDIPVEVSPQDWRKIQMARLRIENPARLAGEESGGERVADVALDRAVDLLRVLKALQKDR